MTQSIILHGGAGAWKTRPGVEKAVETVRNCTEQAWISLSKTNNSLVAVVEAVKCMEDSGYLNAGYGSVLNLLGERELDAGLMTSTGLMGAVGGVKYTKNPILLANIIASETPHVLIIGEGADRLARVLNLPPLPPPPRHVLERYRETLRKLLRGELGENYYLALRKFIESSSQYRELTRSILESPDTVGAVAVDDNGVLSAATSTGGILLKLPGRMGDTPIPGAGFYATSRTACSATGIGEFIIKTMPCLRLDLAYDTERDLEKAVVKVYEYVEKTTGSNTMGFISIDEGGNMAYAYNTEAMLIGYVYMDKVFVELKPEPRIKVLRVMG